MGDWTNTELSRWTQCVWESWFENIAEKAEKALLLDDKGKVKALKQINKLAAHYAEEIDKYR